MFSRLLRKFPSKWFWKDVILTNFIYVYPGFPVENHHAIPDDNDAYTEKRLLGSYFQLLNSKCCHFTCNKSCLVWCLLLELDLRLHTDMTRSPTHQPSKLNKSKNPFHTTLFQHNAAKQYVLLPNNTKRTNLVMMMMIMIMIMMVMAKIHFIHSNSKSYWGTVIYILVWYYSNQQQ